MSEERRKLEEDYDNAVKGYDDNPTQENKDRELESFYALRAYDAEHPEEVEG
jgi:hypothetical protein